MRWTCRGCGNTEAYRVRTGEDFEECDKCTHVSMADSVVPDVYWPGREHYNDNLVDKMGKPILLTSRRHKWEVMKRMGVREAGDPVHGSRRTT